MPIDKYDRSIVRTIEFDLPESDRSPASTGERKRTTVDFENQKIKGQQKGPSVDTSGVKTETPQGVSKNIPKDGPETDTKFQAGLSFFVEPIKMIVEGVTANINFKKARADIPLYDSNIEMLEENSKIKQEYLKMHTQQRLKALGRQVAYQRGAARVKAAAQGVTVSEGAYGALEGDLIVQGDRARQSIMLGAAQRRMGIISKVDQETNMQHYKKQMRSNEAKAKLSKDVVKIFTDRIDYIEKGATKLFDSDEDLAKDELNKISAKRRALKKKMQKPRLTPAQRKDEIVRFLKNEGYTDAEIKKMDEDDGSWVEDFEKSLPNELDYGATPTGMDVYDESDPGAVPDASPEQKKNIEEAADARLTKRKRNPITSRGKIKKLVKDTTGFDYNPFESVSPKYKLLKSFTDQYGPDEKKESPVSNTEGFPDTVLKGHKGFDERRAALDWTLNKIGKDFNKKENYVELDEYGSGIDPAPGKSKYVIKTGDKEFFVDEESFAEFQDSIVNAYKLSQLMGISKKEFLDSAIANLKKPTESFKELNRNLVKNIVDEWENSPGEDK